jgi:serine/threonine protein kinase
MEILSLLNHPGCVKLIAVAPQGLSGDPRSVFVTKLAANGNLDEAVQKEMEGAPIRGWNATKKSICIFGIAAALKYIHSLGVMHRDLTRANIFLNERFEPIVSDFALSKIWENGVQNTMNIGTRLYMAPELFWDEYDDQYTNAVDVYSYGICLYLLFTAELKFSTQPSTWKSIQRFLLRIGKGERFERPSGVSDFLWALINRCWSGIPGNRPSAAEIVEELRSHRSEYAVEGTNLAELESYENRILDVSLS